MSYKISKELFEEVMGKDYSYCNDIGIVYLNEKGSKFQTPILYNDFFFKCIDFMKDNDIQYYLNIDNDIRDEVFEFLDNWLKVNKRQ